MPRYILIDNCSGYIFGDSADLNGNAFDGTPLEYAAALDASIGEHGRDYEEVSNHALASNETGYHADRANDAVPVVGDGTDQTMIETVLRDCEYVTTIRCTREDG